MRQKQTKMTNSTGNARKRLKKRRRSPLCIITILLCVPLGVFCAYKITSDNTQITPPNKVLVSYQSETLPTNTVVSDFHQQAILTRDPPEPSAINRLTPNPRINSTNAVLMDFENGAILFDKNGASKMFPASMTKIMTAIVALEHIEDLNGKALLNEGIFQPIYKANASTAGFLPGENVRIIDLLYGLLLPSGAECAVGLAQYVAGSESAFVSLMNDKAHEIGMDSSNFTNTIGLHDSNHYSTATDMAVLFRYALANDRFYEIITSARYSTPATNKHDGGITFYSTLFSRMGNPDFGSGSILGGKTGYTEEAGQCLASLAVKGDNQYILVTSGAAGNNQQQKLHIDDAFTVYDTINK